MYVTARFKFSASMQRRHNNFQCRLFIFLVLVDRNPTPIVGDANAIPTFIEFHSDRRGIPINYFINAIVQNFPHETMQPRLFRTPNLHRGPFPYRLNAF